ncbi:MAG TPA: DoxX family membrane protein, partial [Flavobacteriaceae bacterium]|nr:DoxX family membrane protein [Flavobacteriaceae bacterium]
MKTLVNSLRIFVGSLFIFSGLVKINDPVGFSFKLEEYFGPTVFDIDFLMPYTLALAIIIVILEVLLGLFLLIGFKPKLTIWVMLLMIIWFTFLTWYSAYYNKVTDCGCFGDAIPLTPWESFTKDVFLLSFILIILYKIELIKPIINFKNQIIVSLISFIVSAS